VSERGREAERQREREREREREKGCVYVYVCVHDMYAREKTRFVIVIILLCVLYIRTCDSEICCDK
jgi:hypothetical protein